MTLPTAKNYGVTRADFPEQDWSVWEARKYNHPGLGQTIDTSYLNIWPCCIYCATWICSSCWDFRRQRADRRVSQYCGKCGGREGFFSAVRHGTRNPHTSDGSHLPKLPFVVPVMSTVGAQWDIFGMISYYKDLAIRNSGRAQLWENQVKDGMTEEEAVAAGMLPAKQVDPEEARGWGVRQPDELEHRDPGYSCDTKRGREAFLAKDELEKLGDIQRPDEGEAKYPFVNDRGDTVLGPETLIEPNGNVVWVSGTRFKKVPDYPHRDGKVLVLGPEVFVNVEAGVLCWRGENWVKQPEPQQAVAASPDPSWQKRDALDWAIRMVAPASSTQQPKERVKQVLDVADKILEWLQK